MIRTLDLVCSECGEAFVPSAQLYYRDNYMNTSIRDTKFICADCIAKWKAKWQIKNAIFHEEDYVMTVDIELEDGTVYHNMDCTPIDETQTVVVARMCRLRLKKGFIPSMMPGTRSAKPMC